jgi:hypothetical protein
LPNQVNNIYKKIRDDHKLEKIILPINNNDIMEDFNIESSYKIKEDLDIIKNNILSNLFLTKYNL